LGTGTNHGGGNPMRVRRTCSSARSSIAFGPTSANAPRAFRAAHAGRRPAMAAARSSTCSGWMPLLAATRQRDDRQRRERAGATWHSCPPGPNTSDGCTTTAVGWNGEEVIVGGALAQVKSAARARHPRRAPISGSPARRDGRMR
jgi:hypothetical protein